MKLSVKRVIIYHGNDHIDVFQVFSSLTYPPPPNPIRRNYKPLKTQVVSTAA